jgi:hypothetical protein
MIKLALLCDCCRNQKDQNIPNNIFKDFGDDQIQKTTKTKKWLKENGIIYDKCGSEYTILCDEK